MALTLFLIFAGTGALIVALAVPMATRRVPPNPMYGLRVSATLEDESIWYEANARSGRDGIVAGIAIIVVALVLFVAGMPDTAAAYINTGFTLVATTVMCIGGIRFANRLRRQRRGHGKSPAPSRSTTIGGSSR